MTRIELDGVALRQHEEPFVFDYPPYAHQLALGELVREEDGFVAVNDSPTGGGKTSSWLAPALTERLNTIAIYPTNALVTDQQRQIAEAVDAVDHDVSVMVATSDTLSAKRTEFSVTSNGEALEQWYRFEKPRNDQVLLLTNPDVFVMFCRDLYRNPSRAYKQFPLLVVDEFHRAERKEQNTLRYLIDELYERDNHALEQVAFLSATPDEEQEATFERAMRAPYHRVTTETGEERTAFRDGLGDGWRAVMPPVDLDVRPAPTFGTADELRESDPEETLDFCRDGRVALILDGIHEVKRVSEWLDDELDRRVERIDGFHGERKREKLDEFDVLVSNSAVEVGIDFELDRLLFAGHDRSGFLQRLGRLRTDSDLHEARCYVPHEVARSLTAHDGERLTRRELDGVLDRVYPDPRTPESFDWRYSASEALRHLDQRLRNARSEREREITVASKRRIERHFLDGTGIAITSDDVARTREAIDWKILDDLQWYRGDSIQALVYDRNAERLRTYDLFYLLRYGRVEFFTRAEFERIVPTEHEETVERQARYVDGFCTYDGTIETTEEGWGRSVAFTGSRLEGWLHEPKPDSSRQPQMLGGVELDVEPREGQPRVPTVDKLNNRLSERQERSPGDGGGLLCYPVTGRSSMVKQQYDLGEFFFLYPVAVHGDTDYSLALGTDALYLHCHVMDRAEGRTGRTEDDDEFIGL
jgi:CRISPR-associated endonuclease/helicase Cas3